MAKAQKQAAPRFMELSVSHASANPTPGAASERLGLKIELERPDGIKLRLQSVGSQETLLLDVVKRFLGEVT